MASLPIVGLTLGTKPGAARVFTVILNNMIFEPTPADLRVGDTVIWANNDIFDHTATADDGSFDVEIKAGARVQVTLTRSGEVAFYCRYHPGMKGRLVVASQK